MIVAELAEKLLSKSWKLALAESCTGGLVAHLLTKRPGASNWFLGSVVSYSNTAKHDILGVPEETLLNQGAVSKNTVEYMAKGACKIFKSNASLAISGIAGPDGGTPEKPVGLVYIAWNIESELEAEQFNFAGTRDEIIYQAAKAALAGLSRRLKI